MRDMRCNWCQRLQPNHLFLVTCNCPPIIEYLFCSKCVLTMLEQLGVCSACGWKYEAAWAAIPEGYMK